MEKMELAKKILSGELKNDFFDKNLQAILDMNFEQDLNIPQIIKMFLEFSDSKKEEIWYLTYEKEVFDFNNLYIILKKNRNFLKGFSRKKFENIHSKLDMLRPHCFYRRELKKTFQESIDWFSSMDKKFPLFSGWIETNPHMLEHSNKHLENVIHSITQRHKEDEEKILVKPLDLNSLSGNSFELISKKMLEKESRIMSNCVRGYSNRLKNGHSRLFHIETSNSKATLEIVKHGEIKIFQLKGFKNKTVQDEEILYIANQILKEIQEKFPDEIKVDELMKQIDDLFSGRSTMPVSILINSATHDELDNARIDLNNARIRRQTDSLAISRAFPIIDFNQSGGSPIEFCSKIKVLVNTRTHRKKQLFLF